MRKMAAKLFIDTNVRGDLTAKEKYRRLLALNTVDDNDIFDIILEDVDVNNEEELRRAIDSIIEIKDF